MTRTPIAIVALVAAGGLVLSGCSAEKPNSGNERRSIAISESTPAAAGEIENVNWNLKYEPGSLDPVKAGNYAENEVIVNLCDSLLRQQPDFSIGDGLGTLTTPDDTHFVFDLNPDAKFWNGNPVTPADVVFSLERHMIPELGSYYGGYFANVSSISATGEHQVTIALTEPDALLASVLATPAGAVLEQAFTEEAGDKNGSPSTGVMCSGPFSFGEWKPGTSLTIERNAAYWDPTLTPKAGQFTFSFISDGSAFTSALKAGDVDGAYEVPWEAIDQLEGSDAGTLYFGNSNVICAMIVSAKDGPMTDPRIRRALSLAIDREGIINEAFNGAALPTRAFAGEASWASAPEAYREGWDALPALDQDVEEAKRLVEEAGSPQETITFAYASGASQYISTMYDEVQRAGKEIGLNIELKAIPIKTYQLLFSDEKTREGIDAFETDWNFDVPDPLSFYLNFQEGSGTNYGNYSNPEVNGLLGDAVHTLDPVARAELVNEAQSAIMDDMAWIPLVLEVNALWQGNAITGAPTGFVQLNYPWAATIGAAA